MRFLLAEMRERSQCICAVEMQIFFTQQCFDQHIIFPVADNVATAVDLKSLPTWNGCWNKYTKLKVMNGGYSSHFSCTSRKSNNIRASLLCTDLQLKSIPEELLHFYILSKKKKKKLCLTIQKLLPQWHDVVGGFQAVAMLEGWFFMVAYCQNSLCDWSGFLL